MKGTERRGTLPGRAVRAAQIGPRFSPGSIFIYTIVAEGRGTMRYVGTASDCIKIVPHMTVSPRERLRTAWGLIIPFPQAYAAMQCSDEVVVLERVPLKSLGITSKGQLDSTYRGLNSLSVHWVGGNPVSTRATTLVWPRPRLKSRPGMGL